MVRIINFKERKNRRILIGSVIIIIVILFVVWAFGINKNKQPANTIKIETPYCSLYYPEQLKSSLKVEVSEDDIYTVNFIGEINGNTAKLFCVYFGNIEGLEIGKIDIGNGNEVSVGVEFYTLEETIEWSQSDKDFAYSMRNAGNELVEFLKTDSAFIDE